MALSVERRATRQRHIVEAAQALIRERGDAGFAMMELAAGAGVSPATPYNLVGSKADLPRLVVADEFKSFSRRMNSVSHTSPLRALLDADYVLVHAGVRPGVALDEQDEEDMTGLRKTFLGHPEPMPGYTVVFGHTPFEQPLHDSGKIGIDTGAYATGVLTALRLFEDQQALSKTEPNLVAPLRNRCGGEA